MKKILGILLCLVGALLLSFTESSEASASSGTVSITTKYESYEIEDEITVVVSVNSSAGVMDVNLDLIYDSMMLAYKSSGDYIEVSDGLIHISDHSSRVKSVKKYKVTFTALQEGTVEFQLATEPQIRDGGYEYMSLSTLRSPVLITEKLPETDTTLSYLRVEEGRMTPDFSSDCYEYELTVSNDITEVTPYADPTQDMCEVSITGNRNLMTGDNEVLISVRAKDGQKSEYKIVVHRNTIKEDETAKNLLKKEESEQKEEKEEKEQESKEEQEKEQGKKEEEEQKKDKNLLDLSDTGIQAVKKEDKLYLNFGQQFQVIPLEDDSKIPSGYVKTNVILDGNSLIAYTWEDNIDNDFLLLYGKMKGSKEDFYYFDRKEKTMMRCAGNPYKYTGKTTVVEQDDTYESRITWYRVFIGILLIISVGLLSTLLTLVLKRKEKAELDDSY